MTLGGHHRFMTELIRRSADGKNLEIFSPSIGTQLVERGRIVEASSTCCRASSATAPACTTSRMGPCPSCRTWVSDDPNAAINLRLRTTYEN